MSARETLEYRFAEIGPLGSIELPLLESMATRASCRKFDGKPVNSELVQLLCALSLSSPSKSDLQQRDIIILEDAAQRSRITGLFPDGDWTHNAPSFLVFCGNNRRQRLLHEWHDIEFANDHLDAFFNATVDAAIALGAFVTAAEAMGLGCCPVSAIRNHSETVSEILGLPDHVFPVAGLGLGWPVEPGVISPRLPLDVTVHRNRYDENDLQSRVEGYDAYRQRNQPYATQLHESVFGRSENYGWSEEKARQYSVPQRQDFGTFICKKRFSLD